MLKKISIAALASLALSGTDAIAASAASKINDVQFSFEGPFGRFDQYQLQRGLQVYTEACSSCHGLQYVPLRTLGDEGGPNFSDDEVRAYAEQNFTIYDSEIDDDRPAKPTDHFPGSSLSNAPDLSLMAKKRTGFHGPYGTGLAQLFKGMGGPEYIVAILNGYEDAPECAPDDFDGDYNSAFPSGGYPDECKIFDDQGVEIGRKAPGSWIAMPPPLYDEQIEFVDGHDNTIHHMAEDVSAFLMWTAEPKMMARKEAGFTGVIILAVLSVLLYLTNKRLWAPLKNRKKTE